MTRHIRNQRKSQKRINAIDPSKQVEVMYRNEVDALLQHMLEIVLDEVRDDKINDAPVDYLKWLTRKSAAIKEKLDSINIGAISNSIADRFTSRINMMNKRRFATKASKTFGIDLAAGIASSGQDVVDQLTIAREYNASLIKSVADEFKQEINSTIMNNIQGGERSTNLITQFKERYGVSESRAKLIARDQTAKVNADLVKARSEAVGSKMYIWSGSMDERERESHRVLEGKYCKWDDPTVFSGDEGKTWEKRKSIGAVELHPAGDYNCRCNALPVVNM